MGMDTTTVVEVRNQVAYLNYGLNRLLKNAHLLRCAHDASLRRTISKPHFT